MLCLFGFVWVSHSVMALRIFGRAWGSASCCRAYILAYASLPWILDMILIVGVSQSELKPIVLWSLVDMHWQWSVVFHCSTVSLSTLHRPRQCAKPCITSPHAQLFCSLVLCLSCAMGPIMLPPPASRSSLSSGDSESVEAVVCSTGSMLASWSIALCFTEYWR